MDNIDIYEVSGDINDYPDYYQMSGAILDGKGGVVWLKKADLDSLPEAEPVDCNCMKTVEDIEKDYVPLFDMPLSAGPLIVSLNNDGLGYNNLQSDYHGSGLINPPYEPLQLKDDEWCKIETDPNLTPQKLKLHLGCGNKILPGYLNIDCRYQPGVDEINNVQFLRNYEDNSVDEIYACHVLEHLGRWNYLDALERWYEILKPGGVIKIAVPDFEAVVKIYSENKFDLPKIRGLLYGGQDYDGNIHTWCWDTKSLSDDLESIGFKETQRYDWRETDHSYIDDFSQCYLPHMDKENGTLMSLNIKAIK